MSGRRAPAPIRAPPATAAAARNPTVTDADLVCGYLNPDYFLGGAQRLDLAAARAALQTHVADPLKMDVLAAAAGIRASSTCAWPTRCGYSRPSAASISRPFRCCRSAAPAPCMPPRSPRSSACGDPGAAAAGRVLGARPALHRRGARLHPLGAAPARRGRGGHAEDIFRRSTRRARSSRRGHKSRPRHFARELDLRYAGRATSYARRLMGFRRAADAASLAAARARLDPQHAQIHGHAAKERAVEVVSYRLRVRVAVPKYEPRGAGHAALAACGRGCGERPARYLNRGGQPRRRPSTSATGSTSARRSRGPPVVEQFDATTVIPPGWRGKVDGFRNLVLERT